MKRFEQSKFYHQLKIDLFKHLIIFSILVTILSLLTVSSVLYIVNNHQLNQKISKIEKRFNDLEYETRNLFKNLPEIINESDNQVKQEINMIFYSNPSRYLNDELIYYNDGSTVKYTTNNLLANESQLISYIRIIQTENISEPLYRMITLTNDTPYLLSIFKDSHTTKVIMTNSSDIKNEMDESFLQYSIFDRFGHILLNNNDYFVADNRIKIDTSRIMKLLTVEQGKILIVKTIELLPEITLVASTSILSIKMLLVIVLFVLIFTIVLFGYHSARISKKVAFRNSRTIQQLIKETELVSVGRQEFIYLPAEDEFGYLADKINMMIKSINQLSNGILKSEKQRLIYEKKMLEAQFNPHFLYNTLEVIRITAYYDLNLMDQLIQSLTKVLRYSLSGNEETNLKDDIEIIRHFLMINQYRFEKFKFNLDIADELLKLKIPKLFLLPIVENSLKYGRKYQEELSVNIRGFRDNDTNVLEVTDNGGGVTPDIIKQINQDIYHSQDTYHGLVNSYRRLLLYYPKAKINLATDESQFTVQFIF